MALYSEMIIEHIKITNNQFWIIFPEYLNYIFNLDQFLNIMSYYNF